MTKIAEAIWSYCNPGFAPMSEVGPEHPDWEHYHRAAVQGVYYAETN